MLFKTKVGLFLYFIITGNKARGVTSIFIKIFKFSGIVRKFKEILP